MNRNFFTASLLIVVGFGCAPASDLGTSISLSDSDLTLQDVEELTTVYENIDIDDSFELSTHHTYFATSDDGIDWTMQPDPIAESASVPDLIELQHDLGPFETGTLLTYFVDGTQGHGDQDLSLGMIYSQDGGESWSDRLFTNMIGADHISVVADPSLVQLEDGTFRLYFYDFPATFIDPRSDDAGPFTVHSATSRDGINFTYEAQVFESGSMITDPDVVYWQGKWWMYLMGQEFMSIQVASSTDPLSFGEMESVNDNGIPGMLAMGDEMWLYTCGNRSITRQTSTDGISFTYQNNALYETVGGIICDPSVIELTDGTFAMVLKQQAQSFK